MTFKDLSDALVLPGSRPAAENVRNRTGESRNEAGHECERLGRSLGSRLFG
jgi:hypothetical protein